MNALPLPILSSALPGVSTAMAPYSAMWWISGTLLALAIAGESAVRNRRRNRLQAMLKPDRLERLDAFLERELELIDSLVIMRLVAFTVLIVGTGLGGDGASTELPDVASRLGALLGVVIVGFYGTIREAVRRMPERALLLLVPFLRVTDFVLSPVRWAMSRLGAGLARVLGVPEDRSDDAAEFRDDVLDAVSEGEKDGVLRKDEAAIFHNLIGFRDRPVAEVMTPRTRVVSLPVEAPFAEAVRSAHDMGHSRIPLHEGTVDRIVGILFVKDLLAHLGKSEAEYPKLRSIMRPAIFVPESKPVPELLRELRSGRAHLAVVLDEYGGTAGIATIEDLIEELVGEIHDELDTEEAAAPADILVKGEQEAEVLASVRVDALNARLGIQLPEDASYDTVGGFVFAHFGRIPQRGDAFSSDGVTVTVLEADERHVHRVRVAPTAE